MKSLINQLSKKAKNYLKKGNQISDITIFGSFMRRKEDPNDIDILVVFKSKIDKDQEYEIKNLLLKVDKRISITSINEAELKKPSFPAREGYIFEGFSLLKNEPIRNVFGLSSFGLFITSTEQMNNKDKTRYYYSLNGRGASNGFLNEIKGIRVSNNLFIIPIKSIEKAKSFFKFWGIKIQYIPILMPARLGIKGIIGRVS